MQSKNSVPETHVKPRRKMEIFWASKARELGQDIMPIEGVDAGVTAGFAKITASGTPPEAGASGSLLFRETAEAGLSLAMVRFKSGFLLPRHSHDCDCLYYVTAGMLKLGATTLLKGDGFFIPAGQTYSYEAGPRGVEVVEFRNATRFNFKFGQNDAAHWERIAGAIRTHAKAWQSEPAPAP